MVAAGSICRVRTITPKYSSTCEDSYHGASRSISLQMPEVTPDGHVVTVTRTLKVSHSQRCPTGSANSPEWTGRQRDRAAAGPVTCTSKWNLIHTGSTVLKAPMYTWSCRLRRGRRPWERTVKVPTPSGAIDLKIPANSKAGKKLRLKGRGIPSKTPGDLFVVLQIVLPPADDEESRALYRRMQEEIEFNPRASMEVA